MDVPTIILRHPTESNRKCTVSPLRGVEGFQLYRFPLKQPYDFSNYVRLGFDGPQLSSADRDKGLLILDATWRRVAAMEAEYVSVPIRSLPHLQTAYPRRSRLSQDPNQGLATIEALYAALHILGRPTHGVLEGYHFKDQFLQKNSTFFANAT